MKNKNLVRETKYHWITSNNSFFCIEYVHDEHRINGAESPNVELFDRTGELFDTENVNWQSSAAYDHHPSSMENHEQENNSIDDNVWSVVDDLTQKTQDLLFDEPQVSSINN